MALTSAQCGTLFTKVPCLLSDSAGKTAKLFGKVKLNIPQPLLGLFSPGNLYLKEAVSYSLTLLVNVCYSVFVSTTFLIYMQIGNKIFAEKYIRKRRMRE